MQFSTTISVGDAAVILGLLGSVVYNYFAVVRSVDKLKMKHDALHNDVSDLRRGRGLILGGDSDWPDAVRRCFGFHGKT